MGKIKDFFDAPGNDWPVNKRWFVLFAVLMLGVLLYVALRPLPPQTHQPPLESEYHGGIITMGWDNDPDTGPIYSLDEAHCICVAVKRVTFLEGTEKRRDVMYGVPCTLPLLREMFRSHYDGLTPAKRREIMEGSGCNEVVEGFTDLIEELYPCAEKPED